MSKILKFLALVVLLLLVVVRTVLVPSRQIRWLTSHGTTPDRLKAQGIGKTKPVANNASDDGRAKNRRVELVKL